MSRGSLDNTGWANSVETDLNTDADPQGQRIVFWRVFPLLDAGLEEQVIIFVAVGSRRSESHPD